MKILEMYLRCSLKCFLLLEKRESMNQAVASSYLEVFVACIDNRLDPSGHAIVRQVKHDKNGKQTIGWFRSLDGSANFYKLHEDHVEHVSNTLAYLDEQFMRVIRLPLDGSHIVLHDCDEQLVSAVGNNPSSS